jgi:hypothetical protein
MTRLLLTLLLVGCVNLPYVPPAPRPYNAALKTDVEIISYCGNKVPRQGRGVIISERHVLTAQHLVDCAFIPKVKVNFIRGGRQETLRTYVIKEDAEADIAKLEIASAEHFGLNVPPPALITLGDTSTGEFACNAAQEKCGVVHRDTTVILHMPSVHGDSGSAVYAMGLNMYGELGAMNTGKEGLLLGIVSASGTVTVDDAQGPYTRIAPVDASWL